MIMLQSIDKLLLHIKEVQLDVIELSSESLLKMSSYIEKNRLEIDEDISTALQYQDIITQQLNATIEAIDSMSEIFAHAHKSKEGLSSENIVKLQEELNLTLQDAKDKKSRFSGKHAIEYAEDEIEFF